MIPNTTTTPETPSAAAPRCLGYVRVSTDRQETDRQINVIRAHAAAQGWQLVGILEEPEGISGRATALKRAPGEQLQYISALAGENFALIERAGYADLLRAVVNDECDIVAFYALDRFSRSCVELLILDLLLRKYSVSLTAINAGSIIDTGTAAGKMTYRLFAAMAEAECDNASERTAATLRNKIARGERVGRPPVGWRAVKDHAGSTIGYEHDPEDWPRVAAVAAARAAGKIYTQIEAELGIHRSQIKYMLDAAAWTPPGAAKAAAAPNAMPLFDGGHEE